MVDFNRPTYSGSQTRIPSLPGTDELLRKHLAVMTHDDLVTAAMDRGLPGPHLGEDQLRTELSAWLALVGGEPDGGGGEKKWGRKAGGADVVASPRDPLRTRLALLGINSLEAARKAPEGGECRMLFKGP